MFESEREGKVKEREECLRVREREGVRAVIYIECAIMEEVLLKQKSITKLMNQKFCH